MRTRMVAGLLVAALLFQAAAAYDCPATCAAPSCHPASYTPPGGLAPADTPQFIVLTNDDAITVITAPIILNITERHQNKNGCKMPATWFVSQNFTDTALVQQMYVRGHEISTHTMAHFANPNATQIVGQRTWLNESAKIPLEDIQGFRAPYLLFSPDQRQILYENGFRYDSSISESWSAKNDMSPSASQRIWPYTMDCGIGQDCSISTGFCSSSERWPGLWEFPMYSSQADDGTVIGTMDPQGNMTEIFMREFNNRYYGNRAPVGIFIHAAWLIAAPESSRQINDFLSWAMTHDNVFLVTISQVLDWIQNPVPASQYVPPCKSQAELLSKLPGGNLCVMPASGCNYGTFNPASCKCECQNENVNAGGYCRDATGSCTIQKDFDFTNKVYFCQQAPAAPAAGAPSTPAATPAPASFTAPGNANCGHPLVSITGVSVSGNGDSSSRYAQAMRSIDGECTTCAFVESVMGKSTYDLALPTPGNFTGIQLLLSAPANVTISVGTSAGKDVCAEDVLVPANAATVVPCNLTGNLVTITYPGNMSICDVYPEMFFPAPVPAPAAPAPATTTPDAGASVPITTTTPMETLPAGSGTSTPTTNPAATPTVTLTPVTLELDLANMTPEQFKGIQAALCNAVVGMSGDPLATCTVKSVTANNRRRRSLLQAQQPSVHVVLEINTQNPATTAKVFSNGAMLSSLLQPLGFNINPTTVEATAPTTPASGSTGAPASGSTSDDSSSDGGSSSNVGVIVGAVVGGVCGALLLAGLTWYIVKRRRAAAANRVDSVANPVYDATATVTTERHAPRKGSSSSRKGSLPQ